MTATFHVGDAIQVMNRLPAKSVDLVLTSPPFLALRSYLPADHPDKHLESGSQATPGAYIDWLIDVVEACARVLAPHGSLCIELGDTYSGGKGFDNYVTHNEGYGSRSGQLGVVANTSPQGGEGWPLPKSLSLIPELFRLTLVYGTNPLTGRTTERWRLRNVVRWVRPNPPVGALGDKFRPATSELMVFCKSAKRYFDLDAVREPLKDSPGNRYVRKVSALDGERRPDGSQSVSDDNRITADYDPSQSAGAPPLDWWNIPPGGYTGAHYAVWPPELCVKPIKAMSPEKVCRTCGEPSRRVTESERIIDGEPANAESPLYRPGRASSGGGAYTRNGNYTFETSVTTLGFTDCDHDDYRSGLVLDPFAGSGTTLAVATGHGRDAIGIDLDERNYELALQRVGPLILQRGEVAA